jgi:hypothetical protein
MPQLPEASAAEVRVFDRPTVMVPVFALIAALGGFFGSFTTGATLLVHAIGGTMVWLGISGRAGRRTGQARLTRRALWWLVPLLVLALTELWAALHAPRAEYPTLSALFDPPLEHYLPRAAGYFAWLAGFWALARR